MQISSDKIRPLQDRIFVKKIKQGETAMPGGKIIRPDSVDSVEPFRALVVAVGPGRVLDDGTRLPVCCAVGDEVMIRKYSGVDLTFEGEDFVILREDDVQGIFANG